MGRLFERLARAFPSPSAELPAETRLAIFYVSNEQLEEVEIPPSWMKGLWSTEGERTAKVSRKMGMHARRREQREDNTSHNTQQNDMMMMMIIILFIIFIIITTTGI